ncbi:MAG: acyl-CoA desaturase [Bacteroidota bacterium]
MQQMTKSKPVKFNRKSEPEFFQELHKRVNQYFTDHQISKHANGNMVFKTAFMIGLYFVPFILLLLGIAETFWGSMVLWTLMGLGMSGIGLSIMHDANHGAYSSNKNVNGALGFILNFIGGYHINWKIQHNLLHHSYTNIHGYDEDIEQDVFRFTPDKEFDRKYRFQAFYAPVLYSLMTIFWVVYKDFNQVKRYNRYDLLKTEGLSYRKAITQVWVYKVLYVLATFVLPILVLDFPWWQTLIGFMTMHFICGLILALIFQPAHVLEDTSFFKPDATGSVENNWAVHQLLTTANFANKSTFFSWFVGGLNYQVEHHLFPHICHVHYRKLSPIVKATAEEYNIPYHQHETFFSAVASHFKMLHDLGTGRYDARVAS